MFLEISCTINSKNNRPWWPSGLSHYVSNSSRDRHIGPRFKSPLEITISIFQNWKLEFFILGIVFSVAGFIYFQLLNCKVCKGRKVMCRYLTTNELIQDQMYFLAIVCQMILALHMLMLFCIDLVPILLRNYICIVWLKYIKLSQDGCVTFNFK